MNELDPTHRYNEHPKLASLMKALAEFEAARLRSIEMLADLALAQPIRHWLEEDVASLIDDIEGHVETVDDSASGRSDVAYGDLMEEFAETLNDLLLEEDLSEDAIMDAVGDNSSDKLIDDLLTFVEAKLEPTMTAGWKLYHIMIDAA